MVGAMIFIIKLIKKNKRLYYTLLFFRGFFNKNYIDKIVGFKEDFIYPISSYGDKNPERMVYFIKINDPSGYFAHLIWILKFLYIANKRGFYPVIYISSNNVYFDRGFYDESGIHNIIEYFFELKKGEFCDKANGIEYINVVDSSFAHLSIFDEIYDGYLGVYNSFKSESFIDDMANVFKRYLILNAMTKEKLKIDLLKLKLPSHYLAVHVRGTDFKYQLKGHPKYFAPDKYFIEIDKAIAIESYEKVFLATDDQAILNQFIAKYGNKLLYFDDTLRSTSNTGVQYLDESSHELSRYQIGYQAIRDFYFLTEANSLICGLSSLPTAARIFKRAQDKDFIIIRVIDDGINMVGNHLSYVDKNFKKMKKNN